MSPYNYGFNNPVVWNDLSGMDPGDDAQKKYEEGEKRTQAKFQDKLNQIANSKANEDFKAWIAEIGIEGVTALRDYLYERKIEDAKSHYLAGALWGYENGEVYVPNQYRQKYWTESINEVFPALRSIWAAEKSGETSGMNYRFYHNLTISNREEGWDAINDAGKQIALEWSIHLGVSGGVVYKGFRAAKQALTDTEVFYRAISKESYNTFLQTGKMPAGSETFISPTREFAASYEGVLIQFNVKKGTASQLEAIGVRNQAINHPNAHLPMVKSGWKESNAYFKLETNKEGMRQVNVGLGHGKALDIFNSNIKNYKVLRP